MLRITDVIKHLIIINVLVFFITMTFLPDSWRVLALYYPSSALDLFRPYQLVTHMFMHAGFGHLAMNMLMLFFLGPMVEQTLGPRKFLTMYFVSGFGALFLHLLVKYYQIHYMGDAGGLNIPVLGASGAIYGVSMAFAVLFPNIPLQLLFIPIPIKAKYMISGFILLDLYYGFTGISSGVAHFAHVGGAIAGGLLTYYWITRWKRR